jgi:uncharacterized protein
MQLLQFIKSSINCSEKSIANTVQLLNDGCTIPFISRYRKDVTGNLNEVEVESIANLKLQFEALEKRKVAIEKILEGQNLLTAGLKEQISNVQSLLELEDLYLPYKKKRNTKAEVARKNGLEPLAKIIMAQNASNLNDIASKYLSKNVLTVNEALEGARNIIAEWVNERLSVRAGLRDFIVKNAKLECKVVKKFEADDKAQKYRDYFEWEELLQKCPAHRLLAILRAEKEGVLKIQLNINDIRAIELIESKILRINGECAIQIKLAVKDAFKRLLFPSLSLEVLNFFREKAGNKSIVVFAKNLKQLLLAPPLGEKNVLAIDPGFKSGCKLVCLNQQGQLLYNETIFPHAPKNDVKNASKKLISLVNAYKIEAIAIGNGTASRETEYLLRKTRFDREIQVFVVNEAGASIYSASKTARDEFPNYDVTVRGAVSIGRRLQDPLAELVKIEPKSIGVGQYQHDVDQNKLNNSLTQVVESCVNSVGVNVNTASKYLLTYVSGVGPKLAENIVEYRKQFGAFKKRQDFLNVPLFGPKAYEQASGFLRIKNDLNPLDDSAVHPESYALVKKMAESLQVEIAQLIGNQIYLDKINVEQFVTTNVGILTLKDIIAELRKPGLDPRNEVAVFTFDKRIQSINDLKEGQLLPGIINNITNFGCFVDIGIKESGLIHVSNLSKDFVKNVDEIVHLNQQVIVKVLDVDIERKRIQLALNG